MRIPALSIFFSMKAELVSVSLDSTVIRRTAIVPGSDGLASEKRLEESITVRMR